MTPADFTAWRARMGWTQPAAARHLGVSVRAIANWEGGQQPIRRPVQLACDQLTELRLQSQAADLSATTMLDALQAIVAASTAGDLAALAKAIDTARQILDRQPVTASTP